MTKQKQISEVNPRKRLISAEDAHLIELQKASIKKANEKEIITKDELVWRVNEIKKCKEDITYFAETYFKIISLDHGLMTIKLYDKQRDLLNFIRNNDRVIVLSSRQLGKSTTYCIYVMWLMCFFPDMSVMIAANKQDSAIEMMSKIRLAYEYLPYWIKPAVMKYNVKQLAFANNSRVAAFATSSSAGRSFSCQVVILDEFAFVRPKMASMFFGSVYPVVSSAKNSKVIIVSTPNPEETIEVNMYHQLWEMANNNAAVGNIEGWKPFRMDWWDRPGHDQAWKEKQIASIGMARWLSEFANEFSSLAANRLLPDSTIQKIRGSVNVDPPIIEIESATSPTPWELHVFEPFSLSKVYVAGVDISEGVGADFSSLQILDVTNTTDIKQVLSFSSDIISINEFAALSARILNCYNCPPLLGEDNGVGAGYFDILIKTFRYPNVIHYQGSPGIHTTNRLTYSACMWMRDLLTSPEVKISLRDAKTVNELSAFGKNGRGNKFSAPKGTYDDAVFALLWALFAIKPRVADDKFLLIEEGFTQIGTKIPLRFAFNGVRHKLPDFANDSLPNTIANEITTKGRLKRYKESWHSTANFNDRKIVNAEPGPPFFIAGYGPGHNSGNSVLRAIQEWEEGDDGPSW
jgi:hypothetical protein